MNGSNTSGSQNWQNQGVDPNYFYYYPTPYPVPYYVPYPYVPAPVYPVYPQNPAPVCPGCGRCPICGRHDKKV